MHIIHAGEFNATATTITISVREPQVGDSTNTLLAKIAASTAAPVVPGFALPAYDYFAIAYIGATNNISTITYKTGGSGGTTVAVLTFTYVAAGAADDDKVATCTLS